jgi:hypothetical protein
MDKRTQDIYVREIKHQAELGLISANSIDEVIKLLKTRGQRAGGFSPVVAAFREMHSMLTHASNLSKLFWPELGSQPKKPDKLVQWRRKVDRAEFLRQLYVIDDSNILADRDLRNHLEHFDERLDDFSAELEASGMFGYVDVAILDAWGMSGPRPDFILRQYRTDIGSFIFRGKPYSMRTIALAIKEVWDKSITLL